MQSKCCLMRTLFVISFTRISNQELMRIFLDTANETALIRSGKRGEKKAHNVNRHNEIITDPNVNKWLAKARTHLFIRILYTII